MKRIEYILKHNLVIQKIYKIVFSCLFNVITIFVPIKKNRILFSSFSGKKYNDSPKVIFDALCKEHSTLDFECYWAFENPKDFANFGLKTVKINSPKYFYIAFSSKYWITNVNIERGLSFKKKNQFYLNTWHGTGPKTAGNAALGRKDYNFKKVNCLCADGEYLKKIFVRDFLAKEENILLCGRPRDDVLYSKNINIESIRKKYGIDSKCFVILYAPTWREPNSKTLNSEFSISLDLEKIVQTFNDVCILFRAHSATQSVNNLSLSSRIIDATEVADISDLYFVSDLLITDFSSAAIDFSILHKPFLCYAPDYDTYTQSRSLYFDLKKEYPFGVQTSTEEVIECIKKVMANDYSELFKKFHYKYSPFGGNATNTCVEAMLAFQND